MPPPLKNSVEQVQNIRIEAFLGKGAFGEVYQGFDTTRNQKVAVKCLRLASAQEGFTEFFKREFELLSRLRHTYLAQAFEFGYWPKKEQYFFSVEFCEGKTFVEAMKDKPLDFIEEAFVQVLIALDCIHGQGIVHFDIKPDNIIVAEENGHPHVKLLDFGIASRLKNLPEGFGGTPAYMAPELFSKAQGESQIDHRVDLYSLGMLMLLTLTGKYPFDPTDPKAIAQWREQQNSIVDLWKDKPTPSYLQEIVEKLLARNPTQRFSNARVVLNFLNLATQQKYLEAEAGLSNQIPLEGPLVGRQDNIIDPLQSRIEDCLFGDIPGPISSVAYISGEMGIGKSRILKEIGYFLSLKEIPFQKIQCSETHPTWNQIAKGLELGPESSEELDEEWRLKTRLNSIYEASQKRPFCLLLDNFQAAEEDISQLIQELATRSKQERKLGHPARFFILTATEETTEEITEEVFLLKRLTEKEVGQYLNLVLGKIRDQDKITRALYQYSGGLPLLMVEGLRWLSPKLALGKPFDQYFKGFPPPKIDLLYTTKITELAKSDQEFIQVLALLQRKATETELKTILKVTPGELAANIEKSTRIGLINKSAGLEFTSQALGLAITEKIDPDLRASLHGKIAEGLRTIKETSEQELAYHLEKSGNLEEAKKKYHAAGKNFEKAGQVALAMETLSHARGLEAQGSPGWEDITLDLLKLKVLSGSYSQAADFLKQLSDYPSARRDEQAGYLAAKQRNFTEARQNYQRALAQLSSEPSIEKIRCENALGNIAMHEGHVEEAVERFKKASQEELQLTPEERRQISNNNLGLALSLSGDLTGATRFYQEKLKTLPPGEKNQRLTLLNGIGYVCIMASAYQDAVSYLHQAAELGRTTGALHSLFVSLGNLVTAYQKGGYYAEALEVLERIGNYQRRMGTPRDLAYNLLRQTSVYLTVGMSEFSKQCLNEGIALSQESGLLDLAAWFHLMDAYWEREFGNWENAKKMFFEAETKAIKAQTKDLITWSIFAQSEYAFESGDLKKSKIDFNRMGEITHDEEFRARKQLLNLKLYGDKLSENDLNRLFQETESLCQTKHFKDLLLVNYHFLGFGIFDRKKRKEAKELLKKGKEIIQGIIDALPEEYRDRYRSAKLRKKLFLDLENFQNLKPRSKWLRWAKKYHLFK